MLFHGCNAGKTDGIDDGVIIRLGSVLYGYINHEPVVERDPGLIGFTCNGVRCPRRISLDGCTLEIPVAVLVRGKGAPDVLVPYFPSDRVLDCYRGGGLFVCSAGVSSGRCGPCIIIQVKPARPDGLLFDGSARR